MSRFTSAERDCPPCLATLFLASCLLACAGPGADEGGDNGDGDGASAEAGDGSDDPSPAYFVVNRVVTPEGRAMFISVLPELGPEELDPSNALEVSGFSRTRSFDGKLYVFDGETGIVTRFLVDADRSLTPDVLTDGQPARLSFANLGITRFTSRIVFVSAQRAFYFDFAENTVIEWNPTTMTITSSVAGGGFIRNGIIPRSAPISVVNNYIVLPISWVDFSTFEFVPATAIAVFDVDSPGPVTFIEDDRCYGNSTSFVHDGAVYSLGDNFRGLGVTTTDDPLPPPCLLRWQPGSAAFDSDHYVDLADRSGYPLVTSGVARRDGTFITQVYTADLDPSDLDPEELLSGSYWQYAVVSIDEDSATVVNELAPAGLGQRPWLVDDLFHVPEPDFLSGRSTLHLVDETGRTSPLVTVTGDLWNVARIR